jgi:hypothetical protein
MSENFEREELKELRKLYMESQWRAQVLALATNKALLELDYFQHNPESGLFLADIALDLRDALREYAKE